MCQWFPPESRHLCYKYPEVGRPVARPFEEHPIITQFMTHNHGIIDSVNKPNVDK